MKIFLIGYMGSGKSTVGRLLAQKINWDFMDFDEFIESKEQKTISQIFESSGEIKFRKLEMQYLTEVLEDERYKVIALGGGTPCYGENMEKIIESDSVSFYLNVAVAELVRRLWEDREHRPLLKHQDSLEKLEEFVRKHLFERSFYYNRADHKISITDQSTLRIVQEIVAVLYENGTIPALP